MKNYVYFLAFIALSACAEETDELPEDLLDEQKFTSVMIDVQLAEGMKTKYNSGKRFSEKNTAQVYEMIFDKHGIERGQFLNTYGYYRENPEKMELIYEAVLDSLSMLEAEVKQEYTSQQKARRDSLDEVKGRKKPNTPENPSRK